MKNQAAIIALLAAGIGLAGLTCSNNGPTKGQNDQSSQSAYDSGTVHVSRLIVPEGALITKFDLYLKQDSGSAVLAFDVPTLNGVSLHSVEIDASDWGNTYSFTLVKGIYEAGRYRVDWGANGKLPANIYAVTMTACHFRKSIMISATDSF